MWEEMSNDSEWMLNAITNDHGYVGEKEHDEAWCEEEVEYLWGLFRLSD